MPRTARPRRRTWSMTRLDAIWNRARDDLVVTTEQGHADLFVWEHTTRVAKSARQIADLPEVRGQEPDELAIAAAALYHDAGWIARYRDGEISRLDLLIGPCSASAREQAVLLMQTSLSDLLPADTLQCASAAVRTLSDREIETIEGQVVREADNLDEFGLLILWPAIRRGAIDGKGVQALIDKWRRQKEYRFWAARLNESFRVQPVRELARRRLGKLERFMEELEEEHYGDHDIAAQGRGE